MDGGSSRDGRASIVVSAEVGEAEASRDAGVRRRRSPSAPLSKHGSGDASRASGRASGRTWQKRSITTLEQAMHKELGKVLAKAWHRHQRSREHILDRAVAVADPFRRPSSVFGRCRWQSLSGPPCAASRPIGEDMLPLLALNELPWRMCYRAPPKHLQYGFISLSVTQRRCCICQRAIASQA